MAAPNPFQYLKHGALLCGRTFATFVETFNFLVDFARNVRGDGEANADGIITVDRAVPDRPIIRSKVRMSMVAALKGALPGCFEIRAANGGDAGGFDNCYYVVGAKIYEATALKNYGALPANKIVCLNVALGGSQPDATLGAYSSFSDIQYAQGQQDVAIVPLYETGPLGDAISDLRNVPTIVAKEW